jgi:hypothetical protein
LLTRTASFSVVAGLNGAKVAGRADKGGEFWAIRYCITAESATIELATLAGASYSIPAVRIRISDSRAASLVIGTNKARINVTIISKGRFRMRTNFVTGIRVVLVTAQPKPQQTLTSSFWDATFPTANFSIDTKEW